MNLDPALYTFIEESRELLAEMEDCLLRVRQQAASEDIINAIFRAAHTIKGSAGLFGLDAIVAFTHVAESLLDEVRNGDVALSPELVQVLLSCCDHMHALIDAVEQQQLQPDNALLAQSQQLMQALQLHSTSNTAPTTSAASLHTDDADNTTVRAWHVAVRFGANVLQNGMDPLSFLRYLRTLGDVSHTEVLTDTLPTLAHLDAEQCYLGFVLHLHTLASLQEIEGVFEFVRDDCELCITPLQASAAITGCDPSVCHQGQCTPQTSCAVYTTNTDAAAQEGLAAEQCPIGDGSLAVSTAAAFSAGAPVAARARSSDMSSVRVDAQKLDHLINLVGELIIASAGATEVARKLRQPELLEANASLTALVEQVRDQALQLRMVKIGATFNKFQRVVHDVSKELGKDIALQIAGEDTELDKTVVERIGDPLTHLVRNAMDHGIEPADVRLARGKPAQGTVSLNAYHESGHIVIEISDDGGGLDRERILTKGVERGLVEPGRALSDKEVFNLIFEPGFSTAAQITNLSGRGVGMDVVRSNITALRGTVELFSQLHAGTMVQVRLPLTLAIINGFQVRVGHSVFVIPLDMVEECVEYTGSSQQHYTDLRGTVLPFVRLRDHFALHGPCSPRPNIVVIKHGSQRFGMLVDELLGEAQTVIKPLSRIFSHARGISGSSILGNGNVALILDIPVLHNELLASAHAQVSSPFSDSVQ